MSGASTERTPLIQSSSSTRRENVPVTKSYKRTYHTYGTLLGFLLFFSLFIHWYRTLLPTPLSDAQASQYDDFSGIHAYNEYLSHFTAPHSANTRENGIMRDWIASVATDLQKKGAEHGVQMDVIARDTSKDTIRQDWFTSNEQWFVDSRNVIIRLNGTSRKDEALLINAHYDSVPTSNGVTDNGMGVVTTLELLRYFASHPPRHTIIFLLNNFEEGGLVGAQSFINHPWYANVKLFINLEGAGAGGRAIMFRCSNLDAVKKLANSKARLKHGSPLGNDMFKAQLIKSDTDYSIFTKNGVPGLDIAFYAPRSHYHTPRDDLAHTTPEALQYMGQLALGAVKSIANSDELLTTPNEQQAFIYYDILGRFMFAYSFTTFQIINVLVLLVVPGVAMFLSIRNKPDQKTIFQVAKEKGYLIAQGSVAVIAAFVISLLFTGVAVFLMSKINPSLTYGDVYGAALYVFAAAFLGLQTSQLVLPRILKDTLVNTDAVWYGLISFWWVFVTLSSFAGSKNIAGLYFAVHILAFTSLAALIHVIVPSEKKFRSPLIFFTQTVVPFILLLETDFLIMDAMRHATADGTPEIAVYILIALPLILIALHFVPWVYVAGSNREVTIATTIVFLFLFTICSALQPFNGSWSPNKLVFNQQYNAGDAFSTVSMITATGIHATLKSALPPREYETLECEPFKTFLTRCNYQTDLLPVYGSNSTLNEFVLSEIKKNCDATTCISSATYASKNSLMCRIYFDPEQNREPIQKAWINGRESTINSNNISSLITYVDNYEEEVNFAIQYTKDAHPQARVSCFYDEWTNLEIPAFTTLRSNLPESAVLLIRGQGLALVHYANITL